MVLQASGIKAVPGTESRLNTGKAGTIQSSVSIPVHFFERTTSTKITGRLCSSRCGVRTTGHCSCEHEAGWRLLPRVWKELERDRQLQLP